ncbi:MAG TPA: hypothetical protein DEP84_14490 [Chloroflexi bacterium]|nr:hypothetical protein [Chloroflexota bacterium]
MASIYYPFETMDRPDSEGTMRIETSNRELTQLTGFFLLTKPRGRRMTAKEIIVHCPRPGHAWAPRSDQINTALIFLTEPALLARVVRNRGYDPLFACRSQRYDRLSLRDHLSASIKEVASRLIF